MSNDNPDQIFDDDSTGGGLLEVVREHGIEDVRLLGEHELVATELSLVADQRHVSVLHAFKERLRAQRATILF
jgi:hypothetical protein